MRDAAAGMLADAALMPGCAALELRYVTEPQPAGPTRIRMFVTGKARSWNPTPAQAAALAACARLPVGFVSHTPRKQLELASSAASASEHVVVELRRDEEVTFPQWDYIPAEFYYLIHDGIGDGSGWPAVWKALAETREPVTVSLLFQQTEIHWAERNTIGSVLSGLALLAGQHTDYDLYGNPVLVPACMNAKSAMESWELRMQRLTRPLLARMAVRAADVSTAVTVATVLAGAVGQVQGSQGMHPMYCEAAREPSDVRQADFGLDWLEIIPWGGHGVWQHENAPQTLRRFPYLYGLDQAASLAILPVPDSQGVAGMQSTRPITLRRQSLVPDERGAAQPATPGPTGTAGHPGRVTIGHALHLGEQGSPVELDVANLTRHMVIVGSSGFGKTTAIQSLLVKLWRDHRVPFLVVEPYPRSEYRTLARIPGMQDMHVYTVGNDRAGPFRFNPLGPPPGVSAGMHQQAVFAALKMALPLFPPQDSVLLQAIPRAFEMAGWDEDTVPEDGIIPPTLRTLVAAYEDVFERIGYSGEAQNIGRGFKTRFEALLSGAKGRALDTVSGIDFADLLNRPVVIELNRVVDADESAVFTSFIIDRIRQEAVRRGSSAGRLTHMTVIEEVQQILGSSSAAGHVAPDMTDPRADAVQSFANAVSTLRAFGEGIVMCTQRPSEVHPQALANSATRLVLHLEEADDRDAVLKSFDAPEDTYRMAARLDEGEAIARWPGRDEVEIVRIDPEPGVDSGASMSDDAVAAHMTDRRREVLGLLPYGLCTRQVCASGCHPDVRRRASRVADALGPDVRAAWDQARREGTYPLDEIAQTVVSETGDDLQEAYCVLTHLAVRDDIVVDPRRDVRPMVKTAIEGAL
jgi:DNA helicase HerA-like ATPase